MKLICFGYGYSAQKLVARLRTDPANQNWQIIGTHRDLAAKAADHGVCRRAFTRANPLRAEDLEGVTHVVISVPPDEEGDAVFDTHGPDLIKQEGLVWLGYLSTTGVYGNRQGAWVDEASPCLPTSPQGARRLAAENNWLGLWRHHGVAAHIFRLPGIYGPGRSAFDSLRAGRARRVIKPGQVFSRIHVADIAAGLRASMRQPHPGAIYNLCDNEPAPPQDVILWASRLLGQPPPPEIAFDQANLSTMARRFYADNKRVRNLRMRRELGFSPTYGHYRAGLKAILTEEQKSS